MAWNHDFICLDPRLVWQAPSSGRYIVQVMGFKYPADSDVRLTGGDGCVYRLHLNALLCPPQLIKDGVLEHEPNGTITNAAMLSLPAMVHGAIAWPGDEDWFAFKAEKDEWLEIGFEAASLGSPLDARLVVMDAQRRELARAEGDGQFHDPHLDWRAAHNETYYVSVGNVLHQGSVSHEYRLSLRHAVPDYKATVTASSFVVHGGQTNEVKLQISRLHGFNRKLIARIQGLPDGLAADPVEVAQDAKEASLKIVIAPEAKATQRPIRIVLYDGKSSEVKWATARLVSASEDNGVPGGYSKLLVESTDEFWLTVRPKPSQSIK